MFIKQNLSGERNLNTSKNPMHIKFHYKTEFELKCSSILDLSLEQVPQELQDGTLYIPFKFLPDQSFTALLGHISG